MRCAVIVNDANGRQMLGLTSDEALRIGENGVYKMRFAGYELTFMVDEKAEPQVARVGALPWPEYNLD